MSKNVEEPPSSSIYTSVGYWAGLLARSMEAEFNRRLAPYGLTRMSYAVLGAMVFDKQTTPSDLADFLGLDRGATSRLLDKLEAQGLVRRDRDRGDRRAVTIRATSSGETLAHEMQAQSRAVNAIFTADLTPEQTDEFIRTVKAMLANVDPQLQRL